MKLTKKLLSRLIKEERQKIIEERSSRDSKKSLNEAMMVPLQPIQRMERKEESLESKWMRIAGIDTKSLNEAEVIDFPGEPSLPWEFGPEGYLARPELTQKMSDLEYGSDSPPELILAIALSNRAEEMLGYKQTVDPAPFQQLGMRLYQDFVVGKAGNIEQSLHDITSRIDAGDYFDEDIEEVMDASQMQTTQSMAAQQDPEEVADDDIDFAAFLDSLDQNVIEFPEED